MDSGRGWWWRLVLPHVVRAGAAGRLCLDAAGLVVGASARPRNGCEEARRAAENFTSGGSLDGISAWRVYRPYGALSGGLGPKPVEIMPDAARSPPKWARCPPNLEWFRPRHDSTEQCATTSRSGCVAPEGPKLFESGSKAPQMRAYLPPRPGHRQRPHHRARAKPERRGRKLTASEYNQAFSNVAAVHHRAVDNRRPPPAAPLPPPVALRPPAPCASERERALIPALPDLLEAGYTIISTQATSVTSSGYPMCVASASIARWR